MQIELKSDLSTERPISVFETTTPLVVVGAHLSGFLLNPQLKEVGATLRCAAKTSPSYRLFNLPSATSIRKPGLKRIFEEGEVGHSIEVEIWDMPSEGMGKFLNFVSPPLAIGSVELSDGTWMKGFVCEPWGLNGATDISSFGGWRAYTESIAPQSTSLSANRDSKPLFKSIVIANRGEIAVRIISTVKKLGIRSVAIYSQEDRNSPHVQDADDAYLLAGDTVASTYLSSEAIIQIAKTSGAEAIIPGYGFLSESAEFAEACESNGLTWIGPTPKQMRSLGLKHLARDLAKEAGVPLLPGTGLIDDLELGLSEACEIGYPVIIKSSAGGGGIGLKKCANSTELSEASDSIRHLGQSFFKDGSIFIEKFVEKARHVEVQIIGDGEGLVRHIGERDCSLQRRKQKVIEEAPAIFIPEKVRENMRSAAVQLASSVSYRGVGTVEFVYDLETEKCFFLEVNTRLQVEHPVTELIAGLDLVEAMIRIAAKDSSYLSADLCAGFPTQKVAIEARIYGESPLQDFRPSPGQLLEVSFPAGVRVDTWVKSGSIVSTSYDPLLAKIIVSGNDRAEAIEKLSAALESTTLLGIETNLEYLKQIVQGVKFRNGTYHTTSLDSFKLQIPAFEVVDPGPSTTIQDFPGRQNLWHAGIPPSGPMDDFAFRLANKVLGNELEAASLECVTSGPTLLFHQDAHVSVAGGQISVRIDGAEVSTCSPIYVLSGQRLKLGELQTGCRAYVAIKGGITVPQVLGSRSTFVLGKLGGHCGRELRAGDIIPFHKSAAAPPGKDLQITSSILPKYGKSWTIKVMPGPHAFPDFFPESSFAKLFENPWKVHYNSNRVGVRLTGPKPAWARSDGGAAGLHPSNIHDSPYSIGSISFTGDEAVILTCDGPSLGGFVVFATVISAEMWKIGQVKPGDEIVLSPVTSAVAMELEDSIRSCLDNLKPLADSASDNSIYDPILGNIGSEDIKILCRQAGNRALLLEFGESEFDIRSSFRIYALMEAHRSSPIPGVVELTAGVRSLHVSYDPSVLQAVMVARLRKTASSFSSDSHTRGIPSRTFHLPLAFDDSASLAAVKRYSRTIREQAPWLPSNIDFLKEINGLEKKEEVAGTLLSATFLVLGLGDVFYGSPCAIPLDPRHRLLSTKYNPSRSFTPEGAVGIGGQFLCIYAIESPGGYQLVGRTVPIWNRWAKWSKPWMFNIFDQIRFYAISEDALNEARELGKDEELVCVVDGIFDLDQYELWLKDNQADIIAVTERRCETLRTSDAAAEAIKCPSQHKTSIENGDSNADDAETGMVLRAGIAGRCWKSAVSVGDVVEEGQTLFWIEAMKMEIKINAPAKGTCSSVFVKSGDILSVDSRMATLVPCEQNRTNKLEDTVRY